VGPPKFARTGAEVNLRWFNLVSMRLVKRAIAVFPLLLIISALAFLLVRLAPGGPFDRERASASAETEMKLRAKYHLDEPVWKQFGRFVADLARGDLGPSLKQKNHSVNEIIRQGLPVSALLGICSFCFALGIGIPLGFYAGLRRGGAGDWLGSVAAIIFVCLPPLVIGPVLAMFFAIRLRLLPVALLESPVHLILPTVTLGLYFAGRIARLMREGTLPLLQAVFMNAGRAKGMGETELFLKHGFRLAVLPVFSYSGPLLADLLTGSFIAESVFQIPGLGVFLVNASLNRDYPLIVGLVLLYAVALLVMNLLVDAGYQWLDPRVRA
jgi:oligopeptide transport system permease protein